MENVDFGYDPREAYGLDYLVYSEQEREMVEFEEDYLEWLAENDCFENWMAAMDERGE